MSEDMRQIPKDAWGWENKENPYGPNCLESIFTENKDQLQGSFWGKQGCACQYCPKCSQLPRPLNRFLLLLQENFISRVLQAEGHLFLEIDVVSWFVP